MSAAQSQIHIQPLPALLQLDNTRGLVAGPERDAQHFRPLPLESSNTNFPPSRVDTTTTDCDQIDNIHNIHNIYNNNSSSSSSSRIPAIRYAPSPPPPAIGDLTCTQLGLLGEPTTIGSLQSQQEEHAPTLPSILPPQPMLSATAEKSMSGPSITAFAPGFGGPESSRGRSSMDGSEDGSPTSRHQGMSLDDLADEFGLNLPAVPSDGLDLGAKAKEEKPDSTPSWSELKTKAGKERKRLPLACIACRRKKIRCSGEKPSCKHCARGRQPCVYKATARKAAPRTDYMAMLDKRLKRMEERIIKIVPKNEQDGIASSVPRANVKPAIPGALSSTKGGSKKRGADEAFGHELEQWARAPAKPMVLPDKMALADMDAVFSSPEEYRRVFFESEDNKLLQDGRDALPDKDIQEHLAEVFFDNVYGQAYHILHKPSYMRKLRAGTLPPVLILSVCAVSARFSNHPKLHTEPAFLRGEEWAAIARDIVFRRCQWPSLTVLTCALIIGLHEFATCHGARSWIFGGLATRMAFALQLHRDLDHDPVREGGTLSFIDREIRRRTMWACFLMDQFNSSGQDRPSFIQEDHLKRLPLPVNEKNFQLDMPASTENLFGKAPSAAAPNENGQADDGDQEDPKSNMGVAAYMIKAVAIWGRIMYHLNQGGKDHDSKPMWENDSKHMKLVKQAEDMESSLPESLIYNADNLHLHDTEAMANQFIFLHIAIQQNILYLNRFATSSPDAKSLEDIPKTFVTVAGAKAFGAANRISEILRDSEPYLITAPFVGYCAFLASTVHIFGVFSGNKAIESNSTKNLGTNIKFLTKMKRFWGMFHYLTDDLREQYRTCADAARRGDFSKTDTSSPIFQYGDWFDRYPNGVSLSDFVDPAIYKKQEKGEDAVLEQKSALHTVEEFFTALSPQSKNKSARSDSISARRKAHAMAAKRASIASGSSDHHINLQQPDRVPTDLTPDQLTADRLAQLTQQGRFPNVTLGGQTSGATNFTTLGGVHSGGFGASLSPVSPVTLSHAQFTAGHDPHAGMYPHDLMSFQLAQNGILPASMLGFGGTNGIHPAAAVAMMSNGLNGWTDGAAENRVAGDTGRAGGGANSADGPHNNPHHTVYGHGHGHDAGSVAWWNDVGLGLDTPSEVSGLSRLHDGLDGFANLFQSNIGASDGMNGTNGH